MISRDKYLYPIKLDTVRDVIEFCKIAAKCPYEVTLANGKHRLNAKSFLGVSIAKVSWEEIFVETEQDCYFEFEKFII